MSRRTARQAQLTADGARLHIAQVELEVDDVLGLAAQLASQQLQQHRVVLLLRAHAVRRHAPRVSVAQSKRR
jgi:hypothetical protein